MKRNSIWVTALLVTILQAAHAQRTTVPVYVSGTEGHKSYRIPAIIGLPGGELLAFSEGRVNGAGDFGDVNIVLKKSRDKGKTWGPLQTIVDYDKLQAGNPAPVLDLTDPAYPHGRVFLFYNTGNKPEGEVRKGNGLREVWYKTSVDGGATWSEAVNITTQVHRPSQPDLNPAYHFREDWRSYANTPGHAIQIADGKYKGRIYVAANHSAGPPQARYADGRANGYYTDDHGMTFHLGEDVPMPGGNENMAVALSHDKLLLNLRNQLGTPKTRIVAISSDGGVKWDTSYYDAQLPDPVCQGSIVALGKRKGKTILAFCNAADTQRRDHLTLRISFDEGRSWKNNYPVDQNPPGERGDFTAYSDIVPVGKKGVGILYERNNYKEIVFTIIDWK